VSLPFPLRHDRLIARGIALGLAVTLLGLGVPQTIASVMRLYAVLDDAPATSRTAAWLAAVEPKAALLERTDAWFGDPDARVRAGVLELQLAFPEEADGTPVPDHLKRAIDDLTEGLAQAPANGMAWALLAEARLAAGDAGPARQALRTSWLMAGFAPYLAVTRAEVGLRLLGELDPDDRRNLDSDIQAACKYTPDQLARMSKKGRFVPVVLMALLDQPGALTEFAKALIKSP
jgi:hypothetical protein